MKYFINEKIFSFSDHFYIKDEADNVVYQVQNKFFSIGDKTRIYDNSGNEVIYIEQEILHFLPVYNIYANGELIVKITKKFNLLAKKFIIEPMNYSVVGDLWNIGYSVYNERNETIANISKKIISIGDKYEIDIIDEKQTLILLGITIVIALIINNSQGSTNSSATN